MLTILTGTSIPKDRSFVCYEGRNGVYWFPSKVELSGGYLLQDNQGIAFVL